MLTSLETDVPFPEPYLSHSSAFQRLEYLGMLGVGAPEVRTRSGAEVSVVAFGLVDPPPAEVPLEVDEERPQAAVVLDVPEVGGKTERMRAR